MACSDPAARREWLVVLALTVLGAVLRCWSIGRLGLEHFDEGIYALAGLWMLDPNGPAAIDPTVIPYAPAGFPLLVGLSYILFGISDVSAIAVSLLCGIATIPVVAWLAKRTFGTGAGAAAAAMAAVAGPHVAYSRMALTDASFLLSLLISLGLGSRLLERPGLVRSLMFGVAVGVAQNLKYNGWLAGAIVAAAVLVSLAIDRGEAHGRARWALVWGIVAAVAAGLVYWPWYLFVERHGSYAALVAHHRSYAGGLGSWWPHWRAQMDQAVALSGGPMWSMAGSILAWFGWGVAVHGPSLADPKARGVWVGLRMGLLFSLVLLVALPNLGWWVALGALPWYLRDRRPAVRLLGMWWLMLTLLTPFYHPYARLWLPLHAATWIVLGGLVCDLGRYDWPLLQRRGDREAAKGTMALSRKAFFVCACVVFGLGLRFGLRPRAIPMEGLLRPTDSLKGNLSVLMAPPRPGIARLLLLGRPTVRFYLATATKLTVPVQSVPDLASLQRNARPGDGAIVDGAVLTVGGDLAALSRPVQGPAWVVQPGDTAFCDLGPATLLDVNPGAAYEHDPLRLVPLEFWTHQGAP